MAVAVRSRASRPLLGLRRRPGRLALAVMRMPLQAYRHGAGAIFGHAFVHFVHVGRKTGRPHEAVAMVLRYDEGTRECVICAAWGPRTDWYRNLSAGSATAVRFGRELFRPVQRFLPEDEAVETVAEFRRRYPHRFRLITVVLGWGHLPGDSQLRAFVRDHPLVAFRPAPSDGG